MAEEKQELSVLLDNEVSLVVNQKNIEGFQMAISVARGMARLNSMITDYYMKEIMPLQNTSLGFKTDKPEGYPLAVAKKCLMEAVLWGVQPWGNQFNIIASNMYITGEGFTYLLKKVSGLWYEIIAGIPKIGDKSAEVEMTINWSLNGGTKEQRKLTFVVKVNSYMGADAVIGKAKRKSKCWLFNTLNDVEIVDADADELKQEVIQIQEEKYDWADLELLYDLKKEKLTEKQRASSERIIKAQEKTGYKKLQEFLAGI